MINYSVGDTITYQTFGMDYRTVIVTERHENIKKGQPGFDGYVVGDPSFSVWGYDHQILTATELMECDGCGSLVDDWSDFPDEQLRFCHSCTKIE